MTPSRHARRNRRLGRKDRNLRCPAWLGQPVRLEALEPRRLLSVSVTEVTQMASFAPGHGDSTLIAIGGAQAGHSATSQIDGYDQIHVTTDATLDGILEIKLVNNYVPAVGTSFDVVTADGTLTGKFAGAEGLFAFPGGDRYFALVSTGNTLRLTVTAAPGGLSYALPDTASQDGFGEFLNDYFNIPTYNSTGNAAVTVGGYATFTGPLSFARSGDQMLAMGTDVNALLGQTTGGVQINDAGLDLLTTSAGTALETSGGTAALRGFSGATLSGTTLAAELNTTGADVGPDVTVGTTTAPLTVAGGTRNFGGTGLDLNVTGLGAVTGDLAFDAAGTGIQAVGSHVTAGLTANDFTVGVTDGQLGLVGTADGKLAMEASGSLALTGGGFASATATGIQVRYNDSGTAFTSQIASAGGASYTFANLPAATDLQDVAVQGLAARYADYVDVQGDFSFQPQQTVSGSITTTEVTMAGSGANLVWSVEPGVAGQPQITLADANLGAVIDCTTDSTLGATQAPATYAMVATGGVTLTGVAGLSVTGTMSARINETGTALNKTVTTPGGDVLLAFADGTVMHQFAGTAVTVTMDGFPALTGSVTVTDASTAGTYKILVAGEQLSGLLGASGKGLQLTDVQLGAVLVEKADSTWAYAAQGSAAATAVGLTGVALVDGSSVGIEVNQIGAAVDETVPLSSGSVQVEFADGTAINQFDTSNLDVKLADQFSTLVNNAASYVAGVRSTLTVTTDSVGNLVTQSVVAQRLPGIGASLDDLLGVSPILDLGAYAQHYLDQTVAVPDDSVPVTYGADGPTLKGLLAYLNAAWLPRLSGQSGQELGLELTNQGVQFCFQQQSSYTKQLNLDFGHAFDLIGLNFTGNVTVNAAVQADVGLTLGLDWLDSAYNFNINQLDVNATADKSNLLFQGTVGALAVSLGQDGIQDSHAAVNLSGTIGYANTGGQGVFNFTPAANSIALDLPVFATLAGTNLYSPTTVPTVHVAGMVYGNTAGYTATTANFDEIADFRNVTVAQAIQMFPDFSDYLASDVQTSGTLLTQIPFTQQNVAAVLPFSDAFNTQVNDKLNFNEPRVDLLPIGTNGAMAEGSQTFTAAGAGFTSDMGYQCLSFLDSQGNILQTFQINAVVDGNTLTLSDPASATVTNQRFVVHKPIQTIQTLQELVAILDAAGVVQSGGQITYDPATEQLSMPIGFQAPGATTTTPLDFSFGFANGVTLSSTDQATLTTTINGAVTLIATMHGATCTGADGLLGIVTDGFHGSLTEGSDEFTSADMTLTSAMTGAQVNIGGQSYKFQTFIDAHTFQLDQTATATVEGQPFTLDSSLFTAQSVTFDSTMIGYHLQMGGQRYIIAGYIDPHTVDLDQVVTPTATAQSFLLEQGAVTSVDKTQLNGNVSMDVVDPQVALQMGFAQATVGGPGSGSLVHMDATASVTLDRDPANNTPGDQQFTFHEINYHTATKSLQLAFSGTAWAQLKDLTLAPGLGSDLPIAPQAEVDVYVQNFLDMSTVKTLLQSPAEPFDLAAQVAAGNLTGKEVVLVLPDLGPAFDFQYLTSVDIANAIQMGLDFLTTSLANEPFYNQPLPGVNRALSEIFSFESDFSARLKAAAATPVTSIEGVEAAFEQALGLTNNNATDPEDQPFSLQLHGQVLDVHVNFAEVFSGLYDYTLDLNSLLPGVDTVGTLTDMENGSGSIELDAKANLTVDAGIHFGGMAAGATPDMFLYDYSATRDVTVAAPAGAFGNPGFAAGSSTVTPAMYQAILAQFQAALSTAAAQGTVQSLEATVVSAVDGSSESAALAGARQLALLNLAAQLQTDLGVAVTFLTGRQVTAADAADELAVPGFQQVSFLVAAPVAAAQASGTHANLGVRVFGQNLEMTFQSGPIALVAENAYVNLDGDGQLTTNDYAQLAVNLAPPAGAAPGSTFHPQTDTLAGNLQSTTTGQFHTGMDLTLELNGNEYPVPGDLHIQTAAADGNHGLGQLFQQLANPTAYAGNPVVTYYYPDIKGTFENNGGTYAILGMLNDPQLVIDGLTFALGAVQDGFESALANSVPLMGSSAVSTATFFNDIRLELLEDLRAKLSGNGKLIETMQQCLYEVLGPTGLNVLTDNNQDGQITSADVIIGWYDKSGNFLANWVQGVAPPANADSIQFNVGLGGVLHSEVPLSLNLPNMSLKVNSDMAFTAPWSYAFGFGISVADGFYVTTTTDSGSPEFQFHANAFLDQNPNDPNNFAPFNGTGTLLYFTATIADQTQDPTGAQFIPGGVNAPLTLFYGGDSRGRLPLNTMMALPDNRLFTTTYSATAALDEALTLSAPSLPELKADLLVNWTWDIKTGAADPQISLQDIRLNVSSLLSDFLKPIAQQIANVLDPFKSVIEAFTTKIDGLDKILKDPTLCGLINVILEVAGKDPIDWSFLDAAESMLNLVDTISTMSPDGDIMLGDITDLGTLNEVPEGTDADDTVQPGDGVEKEEEKEDSKEAKDTLTKEADSTEKSSEGEAEGGSEGRSEGGTDSSSETSSEQRSGFQFLPYLLDINNWVQLLEGGNATLFTYEMPLLKFHAEFEVPIYALDVKVASIGVYVKGSFDANVDLSFGYDTYGIREAIQTGDPAYALDGFYVNTVTLPEFENGKIVPGTGGQPLDAFSITADLGIEAKCQLLIVRASLFGGVEMFVGAGFADLARSVLTKDASGNVTAVDWVSDGHLHGTDILTMLTYPNNLGPANLFNLEAKLDFIASLSVDVNIVKWINLVNVELFRINLFDLTYDAPHIQPTLATQVGSTLYLNTGPNAGLRQYFDTSDDDENFILSGSGGTVNVEYDQLPDCGWYQTYTGVTNVVADMGEGDNTLDASRLDDVTVDVTAGDGKNTLIAGKAGGILRTGNGTSTLIGGAGPNTLICGNGTDELIGGSGDNVFEPGTGNDTLVGGGSNDKFAFPNGYGTDFIEEPPSGTVTFDFSACTQPLNGTLSSYGVEITQGQGGDVRLTRPQITNLILGQGDDTLDITDVPAGTINISDPGGSDHYLIRMGRPNSTKAPGTLNITDNGGAFDEITLQQTVGQDPLTLGTGQVLNGRETVNYNDNGIERLTLMGNNAQYDPTNIIDFGGKVSFISPAGTQVSDLQSTGLRIVAASVSIGTDVQAANFMIDTFQTLNLNHRLDATNNGYIDARVYEDGAAINISADLLVSAGDDWNGDGSGWVRLTSPDGSIVNENDSTIYGDDSHLILKAHDAIGTTAAPILTQVESLTAATATDGAGDIVVVEADDLNLIADNADGAAGDPGLVLPSLTPAPAWLAMVTWDTPSATDWLQQIQDGHNSYAVATGDGNIDLTLEATSSLLTLQSGNMVARGAGTNIVLRADDFDFLTGEDQIQGTGQLLLRATHDNVSYRIGSAAELTGGEDRSDLGRDGYVDLSMRDMAALAPGFALVTIGHRYDGDPTVPDSGNVMYIGDVDDATVVKYTQQPRVVNAALRSDVLFLADQVVVQGDVQAPDHVLEVQSRLLDVQSRNVNDPMGLPDSGLYARRTLVNVEEQVLVSGWIKGDDYVGIDVWGTTGANPMITYDDGPNSLRTDTGSIIETLNAGSLLDIETVQSIKQASEIEALGSGSQININAATSFENMEGGIITAPGTGSSIVITAGTYLWSEAGSAILAGARFDMVGQTPVPVLIGTDATITLNSPNELWVAGSVTSSGSMTLHSGHRYFDHADYFDTIPGVVEAQTAPDATVVAALEAGSFPDALRATFTAANLPLSANVTVSTITTGQRWLVTDDAGHSYVLYLYDANNDGIPDSLQVMQAAYLIGQRGFSFLLTGTLTVLQDCVNLVLTAPDDVIVRGNINVLGAGGNLTIESNTRIYWEGFANVVGDITFDGGVALNGTDLGGADMHGSSVYINPTSSVVTSGAGTSITINGSQDVDILGPVVAGGCIGSSGVTWAGPDSTVTITAGQQVYVDTGILAAKTVAVHGGTAGPDDNRLSAIITTAGGLTAAGLTSDGSGGLVQLTGNTDIQVMGNLLSGGTMYQQFNANGARIGETFAWSPENSTIRVQAGGQAWIGGMTQNEQGATIETGGYLRTNQYVEIDGGANPQGVGVEISGATEIMAVNPAAAIVVHSTGDADIQGLLLAGGFIQHVYDATGQYLGRNRITYAGDSTVLIQADDQIRVGQDLKAGKSVDLIGGSKSGNPTGEYAANGIVLYGSVQMATWQPDSQINLSAPGPVAILAPSHTQEIKADTFIVTADGRLTGDVCLDVSLDKVDFQISTTVTIPAAATANNTSINDLLPELQSAFDNAVWTVTGSQNAAHPVGSTYTSDPADRDVTIGLYDSRFLFTSPYNFQLLHTSSNAALLGLTSLASGDMNSGLPYVLYAPETRSTISIGAPVGPNGKLYIAGKVLANSAINLYSGVSPDGMDVELDWTGLLQTVNGSIVLNPGANAVVRGDVIAGGAGSDVTVTAANSLQLYGSLQAQRNVIITAGTVVQPGTESVHTYGTSSISSVGGNGQIRVTGLNDVVIDSQIGPGSVDLRLVQLASTAGDLTVAKDSGSIQTDGLLEFDGQNVEIAGVVTSTATTPASNGFEVTIDITGRATLDGDISLAGSLFVHAADIEVYNQTLQADAPGQRLRFNSDGPITFGQTTTLADGTAVQQGAVISARDFVIDAAGLLTVGSGVILLSSAADSTLQINAGSGVIAGTIYGGAASDSSGNITWYPGGAVALNIAGNLSFGGSGVDDTGQIVSRGGTIWSTSAITLTVGGAMSQSAQSALQVDVTAGGSLLSTIPGQITVTTQGDLQVFGWVQTADTGSQVHLTAGGQVLIDGLVQTDTLLDIQGGTDSSAVGILVTSSGQLQTALGGHITLSATDGISLQGAIGGMNSPTTANAADITATSTDGAVTVTGRVDAAESIALTGADVNVLAGGTVVVYDARGAVRLRASGTAFVQDAQDDSDNLDAGLVQAPDLVSLMGNAVRIYGAVTSTGSRVLLNAIDEVDVEGLVSAAGNIEINAGVGAAWTDSQLEGTIAPADLVGGSTSVSGAGQLNATGNVIVNAGQDLTVASTAQVQNGTEACPRPLVTNEAQTIYVVTGYNQVAVGTVVVPEVNWVTTTVTEQVGMDDVQTGSVYDTMDTTLTQEGYYNPRVTSSAQVRKTFIEGIDYYNSTDYPYAKANIPVINWSAYGLTVNTPSSNPYSTDPQHPYEMFTQLSDDQRNAVLATLGYLPLYDFSYSNAQQHQTIDGNTTVQPWTPAWAGAPLQIYYVDVAGWDHRYIRMPEGANADVSRVVSQGTPTTWYENVGAYRDMATVNYVQDRTAFDSSSYAGWPAFDADNLSSPARWSVSYNSNGQREFSLTDGRSDLLYNRIPDWQQATTWQNVQDTNGTNIWVQQGYSPVTASVSWAATTWSGTVVGGYYTQSAWEEYGYGSVTLYQDDNFSGGHVGLSPGDYPALSYFDSYGQGNWNDCASSVRVPGGMYIALYSDTNFGTPVDTYYSDASNFGGHNDYYSSAKVYQWQSWNTPIYETDNNYLENWTSTWNTIYDKRLTLNYQWVSNVHDIYGARPRYETYDTSTKVVKDETLTLWQAQPIVEPQTTWVTGRMSSGEQLPFGAFAAEAVHAGGAVTINVGHDATLGGLLTAVTGTMDINAGDNVSIQGLLPAGSDPLNALAANAVLQSPLDVSLTAGATVTLGDAAKLSVANGTVNVTAGTTATLSGEIDASSQTVVRAGTDVTLDGPINSGDLIDVRAGQDTAADGSVNGTFYAELTAANADGDIVLYAGANGGSVTLTNSLLTATDQVDIFAPAGAIFHGSGGTISAQEFYARSLTGIVARTDVDDIDVVVTGKGAITLTNLRAVVLNADAADGSIAVTALGTINAPQVETHGPSGDNSVTLSADSPAPGTTSDLILGTIVSGAAGDLTLTAEGSITGGLDSLLVANNLTVSAWMGLDLHTQVNQATLTCISAGDVSLTQDGTSTLTLTASVQDGSLTVNDPAGTVVLENAVLQTNDAANNVTVTAGGDILIDTLSAGMYYANAADIPPTGTGATAGVHSAGDVTLTAGGQVTGFDEDADIDLVANVLTINAQTGITGLELAVNELNAVTTTGSINLSDYDSAGETAPGLIVTAALAPAGSVTITAQGDLEIHDVVATGTGGTARLTSSNGGITIVQPNSGNAITISSGLVVSAAEMLQSYTFFQAPDLLEYHAGEGWDFNGAAAGDGLPTTLTGGTIVLDDKAGLLINDPLTVNATTLELQSDANVYITADLLGAIGTLDVTASGTRAIATQYYDEATGQMESAELPSGNITIQTNQINAAAWNLRAPGDICVSLASDATLVGGSFLGGLTDTAHAAQVTLETPGALRLAGVTISADQVTLKGASITATALSTISANAVDTTATGDISLVAQEAGPVTVSAQSTGTGNITINTNNDTVLQQVVANNGAITVFTQGNLTALDVEELTDGAGKDIKLIATGNLYVDYADAGEAAGTARQASQVTLQAGGTICEPPGRVDPLVDVLAWRITLYHGAAMPACKQIQTPFDAGTSNELEVTTFATPGLIDGGSAPPALVSNLVFDATPTGTYGGTTSLTATLTSIGSGVGGKEIDFLVNGVPVGSATTNAQGVATLTNVSIAGCNAGTHTGYVSASFPGDSSYGFSSATSDLAVAKAALTITATTNSKIYDDLTTTTATPTVVGLQGSDSVTGVAEVYDNATAGTGKTLTISAYTVNDGNGGNNYTVTTIADTTGSIAPKNLTMSGLSVPVSKTYDGTDVATISGTPALPATDTAGTGTTLDGAPYTGDDVSITGTPTATYNSSHVDFATTVTFGGLTLTGAAAQDYTLTIESPFAAVISQAHLIITADNQTKVYGDPLPTLTASYNGFVPGETPATLATLPTLTTTATVASHVVGSPYTITAAGAIDDDYSFQYVDGGLTVTPAPLRVVADDKIKIVDDPVPTLTYHYEGFVLGEGEANLTPPLPTLSTTATIASHMAGNPYPITFNAPAPASPSSTDYAITFVPGTLTVILPVETLQDVVSSSLHPISLREAINMAADSGDTITFDASLTANGPVTINLPQGELDIAKDLTIQGPGDGLVTLSGGNTTRVFNIAGSTVTVNDLDVANANAGAQYGGAFNNDHGTLTLNNDVLSGNFANYGGGGVYNLYGVVTANGTTFTGGSTNRFGGGLYNNSGSVTLTGDTFTGNSANQDGGAVYSANGPLTVSGSSITGNTAGSYGGGVGLSYSDGSITNTTLAGNHAGQYGGGLYADHATQVLYGVTLSGNTATSQGGGLYVSNSTMTIINSTLAGNTTVYGGGIMTYYTTLNLTNDTIATNTASTTGGGIYNQGMGTTTANNTIVAANSVGNIAGDFAITGSHNLVGGNALLGSLANNGGSTQTMALLAGSPAIDAGSNALAVDASGNPLTTDQRGSTRIITNVVDIGAYEFGAAQQQYLTHLYNDLLLRAPDPAGLNAWTSVLAQGASYQQVATDITSSREYDGIVVDKFYVQYLGRHAEDWGLQQWIDRMQAGYNAEAIRAGILGSAEYFADTGGTNGTFVTALYSSFLGRAPDAGGFADWTAILDTGADTRQDVASRISNSDENRTDIITGFYQTYMLRAPDPGGLADWKNLLANGVSQPAIITAFVTSPEYLQANL